MTDNKQQETIKVGDKVTIVDEFGKEVTGTVTRENAFDVKGQWAIRTPGSYGVYSRSAKEIKKAK